MYLKKITKIKNVGRFRNASVKGGEYGQLTMFYAGNGHGKTTLCAVLRSLQCNDANHVLERQTLDGTGTLEVELLTDQGVVRFRSGAWSGTFSDIHIFDAEFVHENVHTGTEVDTEQRRNFYRVVIGPQGVKLAHELDSLDADAAKIQSELTAQRKLIEQHVAEGMTFEQFTALVLPADVEQQLQDLQVKLKAASDAAAISTRSLPSVPQLPMVPSEFEAMLGSSVAGVSADAAKRFKAQLDKHDMNEHGERWITYGLAHIKDDDCPFCGQSLATNSLIDAYGSFFSDAYKGHIQAIADLRSTVDANWAEAKLVKLVEAFGALEREAAYWKNYTTIDLELPTSLTAIESAVSALRAAAITLIEIKVATPLEPITGNSDYSTAKQAWDELGHQLAQVIQYWTTKAVPLIMLVKATSLSANKTVIEQNIARLEACKKRHGTTVAPLITEFKRLAGEKERINAEREKKKKALDAYDKKILKDYENSINKYLSVFGAGFKFVDAKKNYVGKVPQSTYGLQFGTATLDVAAKSQPGKPSFRTTMSAGDKSTLALAFFLAQLDHDPDLAKKVVIFDDPFTSLDDYRREVTAKTIVRCAGRTSQVLVMSHDKHFLKTLQDRMPTGTPATFQVSLSRNNSSIEPWDLDREVREGYLQDHMRLQEFAQGITTDAQAMRTLMRPLLEKYIRYRFPNQIPDGKWLGEMIAIVRADTSHPLQVVLADLEDINDYTAPFHHDPNTPFNAVEVATYVNRTLDIVGGC